jgi:NAD(P)-dependent dehydrogenase (short-subunit alcohol dehydrogenase family)
MSRQKGTIIKRRTYLVTGATKGMGRALSEQLAAQGHQVIGLARNVDDASFPGILHSVDLGDEQATALALDALCREHAIDGVVNNVGFVRLARIGDIDLADRWPSARPTRLPRAP